MSMVSSQVHKKLNGAVFYNVAASSCSKQKRTLIPDGIGVLSELLSGLRCPVCALATARLRCTQTAAHQSVLLEPPPAAQNRLGQIFTGFASSNLYPLIKNQPSRLG